MTGAGGVEEKGEGEEVVLIVVGEEEERESFGCWEMEDKGRLTDLEGEGEVVGVDELDEEKDDGRRLFT